MNHLGEGGLAEGPCQEAIQAGLIAPADETLLLEQDSALRNLALQHSGSCLNLSHFQIVNELWQELVQVEPVRLLKNEL